MDFYGSNYYPGSEFEPLGSSKKSEKESNKREKAFKKVKKFFRKLCDKVIDTILYTFSQVTLRFFDRKFEKMFA